MIDADGIHACLPGLQEVDNTDGGLDWIDWRVLIATTLRIVHRPKPFLCKPTQSWSGGLVVGREVTNTIIMTGYCSIAR